MKTIEQIIEDQQSNLRGIQSEKDSKDKDQASKEWTIKVASGILQFLRNETLKTESTNRKDYTEAIEKIEKSIREIPKTERVSVQDLEKVVKGLEAVKKQVAGVKFPDFPKIAIPDNKKELKAIETAVKGIKIPEVKIPEFPEIPGVDFAPLVKEVKALEKAIHDSKYSDDKKIEKEQTVVLGKIESGLNKLAESLNKPATAKDRTDDVLEGLKDVSNAIKKLRFPVPNFSSSWQHSLTMQSEDLAKTIAYRTIGEKEVIDYFEFVGTDGYTYRKTYNYRDDGKSLGWTAWEKQ